MNDLLDLDDWVHWTGTKAVPRPGAPSGPKIKIESDSENDVFTLNTTNVEAIPQTAFGDTTNATEPADRTIKLENSESFNPTLNEPKTLGQNTKYKTSFPIPVEIAAAKAREFTRAYFPRWAAKNLEETTPPHIRQILATQETKDRSPLKRSVNKFVGDLTKDSSDNTLFVSGLTNDITEHTITHYFAKYGYIDKIQRGAAMEGYGRSFFVRFHTAEDAESAMSGLEGVPIRSNDGFYPMDIQKAIAISSSIPNSRLRLLSSETDFQNSALVENGDAKAQEEESTHPSVLFFRNLAPQVTTETLREGLHIYGHINEVKFEPQFPGHGMVKMGSDDASLAALKGLQRRTLYGRKLEISNTPFDQAFAEFCGHLPPPNDSPNNTTKPLAIPVSEQIAPQSSAESPCVELEKAESEHVTTNFGTEDPFVEFEKSLETKFQDFQKSTVESVQQALNALRQSVEVKFQDAENVQQRMLDHQSATSDSILALLKSSVIDDSRLQAIEETCQETATSTREFGLVVSRLQQSRKKDSEELVEMRKLLTSVVSQGLENIKLKGFVSKLESENTILKGRLNTQQKLLAGLSAKDAERRQFLHENGQLTSQVNAQAVQINALTAENNALKAKSYDFTEALSKQKSVQEIEVGRLIKQNKDSSVEIGALRIENQGLKAAQKTVPDVNKSIMKELKDLRSENDRLKTRLIDGNAIDEDDPEVVMLRESLDSESAICEVLRQKITELSDQVTTLSNDKLRDENASLQAEIIAIREEAEAAYNIQRELICELLKLGELGGDSPKS